MKPILRQSTGILVVVIFLLLVFWFVTGLPRTFTLRDLSRTPGLLVYADDSAVSERFRRMAGYIESFPLPVGTRNFLLRYCEAKTDKLVARSLHPLMTADQVRSIEGLEIINFLDINAGEEADEVVRCLVRKAPNLRILHIQGSLTGEGMRTICEGFPKLEDLFLADAMIEHPIPELENGLRNLQGMTFANCQLGRGFNETLENRPDVKIAHQ